MCGIVGEVRFDTERPETNFAERVNEAQRARGPDGYGVFQQKNIVFGHRRLKIMDLSDASAQPLFDPNLGLCVVFNGAIYNYRTLRRELEHAGYTFFSDGDTEVILKAFHAWGPEMLHRLNGMFALAIWHQMSGRVFVARDRLGIKPLYIQRNAKRFRFASTLTSLLIDADQTPTICPKGLHYYLNFHAIVPAPNTIIEGIEKLPPGHSMMIEPNAEIKQNQYWQLSFESQGADRPQSDEQWQSTLLTRLREAVKMRNVSALDVGVLLSGGVDSSLLVGLLAEQHPGPINTFSIGFDAVGNEAGDEFQYSDIIAKHFSTKHHKIRISEQELMNALPHAIEAMSEPMVSHDCVAFYMLAQKVKPHCSVVQSGQGADEIFGGYHWYPPMINAPDPLASYRKHFFDRSYDEYRCTVNEAWHTPDYAQDFVEHAFKSCKTDDPVSKALFVDTTTMLVEDPVKRVDNMTMASSLEARVPFLDHELVEFAARIPSALKVRDGGKWILKETARQVIPAAVIDRPKGYFPVPALKYLRGEVLEQVRDTLNSQKSKDRHLFRPQYVSQLIDAPDTNITPLGGSKLWQIALLELWLQAHRL